MRYKIIQRDVIVRMHNASGERRMKVTVVIAVCSCVSRKESKYWENVRREEWVREVNIETQIWVIHRVYDFRYTLSTSTHARKQARLKVNEMVLLCVCELIMWSQNHFYMKIVASFYLCPSGKMQSKIQLQSAWSHINCATIRYCAVRYKLLLCIRLFGCVLTNWT